MCFSIVPAFFCLLGLPILLYLYPKAARDDAKFLAEVQSGLAQHANGEVRHTHGGIVSVWIVMLGPRRGFMLPETLVQNDAGSGFLV